MMWKECYDTAIHPSSEARATRGWKMNREIVNCAALKLSQGRAQGGICFAPTREAAFSESLEEACHQMLRTQAELGGTGEDTTLETVGRRRGMLQTESLPQRLQSYLQS